MCAENDQPFSHTCTSIFYRCTMTETSTS